MRLAAGLASLILAGCTPPAGNQAQRDETNRGVTNRAAEATSPVANSLLVGRWADVGASCANPVEIFGNGTFRAVDGSRGHWRYEGDRLTINVGARVFSFQVLSLTRDRIDTIDQDGQRGASVRCP